jgi:hypothetical protein
MNWKSLSILSGVAIAALAGSSIAEAQTARTAAAPTASARAGASFGAHPRFAPSAAAPTVRSAPVAATSGRTQQFAGRRDWGNRTGNGDWRNRTGDGRHHRHHRYYYGGYPYYGYGYPFGYGYGYGYPYFGTSATFYFDDYDRYDRERVYSGNGGGSLNVRVQQQLARAGYYHGAIDGVIGNGTRSAIRAYERANGLPVDGEIDDDLLARLRVS